MSGEQLSGVERLDFTRYGFDAQFEYAGLNLLGAYVMAKDDNGGRGYNENDLWYVEGFYVIDSDTLEGIGIPGTAIVPTVRVDVFEENDGDDEFTDLTVNLSYYPWDNVRVYTEYFDNLDTPSGTDERWRWTVQVEVAF